MAYPKSFIDELKHRNNIVETIGRYVDLKRAGSNMLGLCPFHSERTPSFTVFQDNFHCFGCGAGGDVITFTMRMENLDYRGAIELLAQR
ncbi:MAG: DNA primase, partial [Ruminococcaceae bacterium]|nr:DNA primase [Oscillospiraceae bacterium]